MPLTINHRECCKFMSLLYTYTYSSYYLLQHIIIVVGVEGMDLLDLVQQVHHQALLESCLLHWLPRKPCSVFMEYT